MPVQHLVIDAETGAVLEIVESPGYPYAVVDLTTNEVARVGWDPADFADGAYPDGFTIVALNADVEDPGPGRRYDPGSKSLVADVEIRAKYAARLPAVPRPGSGLADAKTRAAQDVEDARIKWVELAREKAALEAAAVASGLDYSDAVAAKDADLTALGIVADAAAAKADRRKQ